MSRHYAPRFVATATGNEGGSSYRYGAERSTAALQFNPGAGFPMIEIHGRIEGTAPWVRVVACQDGRHRVLYDGPMDRIVDGENVQPKPYGVAYLSRKVPAGERRIEWYESMAERDTAYAVMLKTHEGVERVGLCASC